jgi:membrane protease YdiL (CAAX protease family)
MQLSDSRWRDAIALTFASLFPLATAYLYFVVLNDPDGTTNRIAYLIGKTFQFGFPVAFVCIYYRDHLRFTAPSWRGIQMAVAFSLGVGVAMFALYFAVVKDIPAVRDETPDRIWLKLTQSGMTTPLRYLGMGIFLSCVHSLAEEYYWRWFVYGWMRRHLPVVAAIVLSSIGFMLHHVVVLGVFFPDNFWLLAMPFSLGVAIGGGVWAWIYERSGSLYAPWLSHALIDGAIMAIGYVMLESKWQ